MDAKMDITLQSMFDDVKQFRRLVNADGDLDHMVDRDTLLSLIDTHKSQIPRVMYENYARYYLLLGRFTIEPDIDDIMRGVDDDRLHLEEFVATYTLTVPMIERLIREPAVGCADKFACRHAAAREIALWGLRNNQNLPRETLVYVIETFGIDIFPWTYNVTIDTRGINARFDGPATMHLLMRPITKEQLFAHLDGGGVCHGGHMIGDNMKFTVREIFALLRYMNIPYEVLAENMCEHIDFHAFKRLSDACGWKENPGVHNMHYVERIIATLNQLLDYGYNMQDIVRNPYVDHDDLISCRYDGAPLQSAMPINQILTDPLTPDSQNCLYIRQTEPQSI